MHLAISYHTGRDVDSTFENEVTAEKGQYSVRGKIYKPLLESTRPFIFLPFILRGKRPFSIAMIQSSHKEGKEASEGKR